MSRKRLQNFYFVQGAAWSVSQVIYGASHLRKSDKVYSHWENELKCRNCGLH